MKNVLIHVKDDKALSNYKNMLGNKEFNEKIKYSKEVKNMIEEFFNNNWGVYLTTIENFKDGIWKDVYFINENKTINMTIDEANEEIGFMIIRNLGSVEGNFKMIKAYLDFLIENYKGKALNNPIAMKKGMTKNYLVEVDGEKLKEIGILTIPTKAYSKKVEYNQIKNDFSNLEKYLIKPITGELSNSLNCLNNIDEDFLRKKQSKVGGWVVQPIKNEIWNGEYQLVFVGGKLIYGQKKNYKKELESNIPNQKSRIIEKYCPSKEETKVMKNVINYFTELYNFKIDICRIDFMKKEDGTPILIEFEMVNPGFFIGYMKEDDEAIKNIVKEIREYCEK